MFWLIPARFVELSDRDGIVSDSVGVMCREGVGDVQCGVGTNDVVVDVDVEDIMPGDDIDADNDSEHPGDVGDNGCGRVTGGGVVTSLSRRT